MLEAITNVPLDARALRVALTGCASAPDPARSRQLGDDWRVVPDGDGDIYLHRNPHVGPWRLVAAVRRASNTVTWRAEYGNFATGLPLDGLPRTVRLKSVGNNRFDLRLALSQVAVNETLDDDVFTVRVPATATPITLAELQKAGPLSR